MQEATKIFPFMQQCVHYGDDRWLEINASCEQSFDRIEPHISNINVAASWL